MGQQEHCEDERAQGEPNPDRDDRKNVPVAHNYKEWTGEVDQWIGRREYTSVRSGVVGGTEISHPVMTARGVKIIMLKEIARNS